MAGEWARFLAAGVSNGGPSGGTGDIGLAARAAFDGPGVTFRRCADVGPSFTWPRVKAHGVDGVLGTVDPAVAPVAKERMEPLRSRAYNRVH